MKAAFHQTATVTSQCRVCGVYHNQDGRADEGASICLDGASNLFPI
jgi:hypothetical protein